jgi:hypothetical protein
MGSMSIPDATGSGLGFDGAADAGIGPGDGQHQVDMSEAARQLQQAAHDATVAYDCIGLGELARAQTYAITARAAVDAAEAFLRVALGGQPDPGGATTIGGL